MQATHIVGGELYYDYLGGNNYKITLRVYRDCSSATPFDNPAALMIFNNGGFVNNIQLTSPSVSSVPDQINNPCITTPTRCIEEAIYTTTVNLPPVPGGYDLVYQRCCRNSSIINLQQPGSVGSTFMEHIPGSDQVMVNSSPRFTRLPLKFMCKGIPIGFDHAASDPDGDSLVYELCAPFGGLDACCPVLSSNPGAPGPFCPSPPASCSPIGQPPPYATVPFLAPYSGSYPLSSNPAIQIHPQTGFLDGIPNIIGQWVVGVCVLEYRNGILIGTHKRDFQFTVVQCTVASSAAVADQTTYCDGFTVDFHNLSVSNIPGGASYSWNFGDPAVLGDTSHLFEPGYTYADTGRYTVQLIVNEGKPCSDTTQLDFYVYPELDAQFSFSGTNACSYDNSFDFTGGGTYAPYATFDWNFGAGANPLVSSSLVQNNVVYSGAGAFPVTLTMHQAICSDTYTDTVHVYPGPQAYFSPVPVDGCQPQSVSYIDSSSASTALSYLWVFGDGDSSTAANPMHVYSDTGTFTTSLTVWTTSGCIDTNVFIVQNLVSVKPSPVAGFIVTPTETDVFNPVFSFTDTGFQVASLVLQTGDGYQYDFVPPAHYYEDFGEYTVTEIALGSNGCPDTFRVNIKIRPEHLFWIPNAFTPNTDLQNPVFKPEMMGELHYEFSVFDRWGQKVFETGDSSKGWDGTYKGLKCPEDVYVYLIRFMDVVNQEEHQHSGTVLLIR